MPVVGAGRIQSLPLSTAGGTYNGAGGTGGVGAGMPGAPGLPASPPALAKPGQKEAEKVADFAKKVQDKPGDVNLKRGGLADEALLKAPEAKGEAKQLLSEARDKKDAYDKAARYFHMQNKDGVQAGKL